MKKLSSYIAITFAWLLYRGFYYIFVGFATVFVLLFFCVLFSLSPPTEKPTSLPPPHPPPPKVVNVIPLQNIQQGISILEIDGCEYLLVTINNNVKIIHKQNCKNH